MWCERNTKQLKFKLCKVGTFHHNNVFQTTTILDTSGTILISSHSKGENNLKQEIGTDEDIGKIVLKKIGGIETDAKKINIGTQKYKMGRKFSKTQHDGPKHLENTKIHKQRKIPPLQGANRRIYSDEGKAELFANTIELTCRKNDYLDEDIDQAEDVDRTVRHH